MFRAGCFRKPTSARNRLDLSRFFGWVSFASSQHPCGASEGSNCLGTALGYKVFRFEVGLWRSNQSRSKPAFQPTSHRYPARANGGPIWSQKPDAFQGSMLRIASNRFWTSDLVGCHQLTFALPKMSEPLPILAPLLSSAGALAPMNSPRFSSQSCKLIFQRV